MFLSPDYSLQRFNAKPQNHNNLIYFFSLFFSLLVGLTQSKADPALQGTELKERDDQKKKKKNNIGKLISRSSKIKGAS